MKRKILFIAFFAFGLSMASCTVAEEDGNEDELDMEMTIDEKELEDEFEKVDNDVKKVEDYKKEDTADRK